MKIELINEIFDRPTLDNVQVLHKPNGVSAYGFKDALAKNERARNTVYVVRIKPLHGPNGIKPPMIRYVQKHAETNEELRNAIADLGPLVSIDLEANKDNDRTNFGNQYYVYGKLIACVWDYIKKNRPIGLFVMGVDSDMDVIYNKLVKLGSKMDPNNAYVLFGQDNYMRKDIADLIGDYESERSKHIKGVHERLSEVKAEKNASRNKPIRRDFA